MAFLELLARLFVGALGLISLLSMFVSVHIAYVTCDNRDNQLVCVGQRGWFSRWWPRRLCNAADVQLRDSILPCVVFIFVQSTLARVYAESWFYMALWFTVLTSILRIYATWYYADQLHRQVEG